MGHLYPGRRFYGGRWRTPEQIERFRKRSLEYRKENKEACSIRTKQRYQRQKRRLDELKSSLSCGECGFDDPRALDFHHRNPAEKKFRLATGKQWSWHLIEAEIAKCDVLCANCHRILHAELPGVDMGSQYY